MQTVNLLDAKPAAAPVVRMAGVSIRPGDLIVLSLAEGMDPDDIYRDDNGEWLARHFREAAGGDVKILVMPYGVRMQVYPQGPRGER